MTRAGEKLYAEPEKREGSALLTLITHPQTARGFRDTTRVMLLVLVGMWFFGLG